MPDSLNQQLHAAVRRSMNADSTSGDVKLEDTAEPAHANQEDEVSLDLPPLDHPSCRLYESREP